MTMSVPRYELVLAFDCKDGNPNGDPDAGNMPRVDPETLHGLVSDVCQKRKVRDWVYLSQSKDGNPLPGYDIFFGHSGLPERQILNNQIAEAHEAALSEEEKAKVTKATEKDKEKVRDEIAKGHVGDARDYLCRTRFDIRTFGAVLSTGRNAGQVRGPVQCTFARSVDPILSLEAAITRKAVATAKDAADQMAKDGSITGTMGRKNLIPYGLYVSHWFVSPMLATQTGFSAADFKLLCDALLSMWEVDRSASRGLMATRGLIVFRHKSALGNARSHELLERVTLARNEVGRPPRSFQDYTMKINRSALPEGVDVFDLCVPDEYAVLFPKNAAAAE
ncbi:MAG: type I-C CRISPR-associated protein Cas7/Csd2 [Minicystis sp.]